MPLKFISCEPLVMGVTLAGPKPIKGAPAGRQRIKMRLNDFTFLFVRPPEGGVRKFYLRDGGDEWVVDGEIGANRVLNAQDAA